MDNTLKLLIKYVNKTCQEPLTVEKDKTTINNRGYILRKKPHSIKCKNKEQLIIDLIAEVHNQGQKHFRNKTKRLLEV